MKKTATAMLLTGILAAGVVDADDFGAFSLDFVNIGNKNNIADTGEYGAVGYNYRIGVNEVSINQFLLSGIVNPTANYWNDGVRTVGTDAPVVNITWHEAARFCNWLTSGDANAGAYTVSGGLITAVDRATAISAYGTVYVLPTEDEWYKAAYYTGSGYSTYAKGPGILPVNGVDAMYGTNTTWAVTQGTVEQNGTYNMMGNVFEWLETSVDKDLTLDGSAEDMAFRGGGALWPEDRLRKSMRVSGVYLNGSPSGDISVGMRVVSIPEPGTISLMSLSTIGLFFTRTMRRRKLAGKSLLPVGREYLCDTFATYEEWQAAYGEMGGNDYMLEIRNRILAKAVVAWRQVATRYKVWDKIFWNRMVLIHEYRTTKAKAVKSAVRRKALECFDTFLSLIMK